MLQRQPEMSTSCRWTWQGSDGSDPSVPHVRVTQKQFLERHARAQRSDVGDGLAVIQVELIQAGEERDGSDPSVVNGRRLQTEFLEHRT